MAKFKIWNTKQRNFQEKRKIKKFKTRQKKTQRIYLEDPFKIKGRKRLTDWRREKSIKETIQDN